MNKTSQDTTYLALLNDAIVGAQNLLTTFAFSDRILADFNIAFGSKYDREIALSLISQWKTGDFNSFPLFEIRSAAEINGANGAYSVDTNKIYIAEEFLLANTDNVNAIVDLVLEEYGHFVDAQINLVDAKGDEGAIFASLVQGNQLNQQELLALKQENDVAVVNVDGNFIQIEQNLISGNDNPDLINGTPAPDSIYGHGGADTLYGHGGADTLYGWTGNDFLIGNGGNDLLYGNQNDDRLHGDNGADTLDGGAGNDFLVGWTGKDFLIGNGGNDSLYGDSEDDRLHGDAGNDILYGGEGNDLLAGWTGNDYLQGGPGNDQIYGDDGNDTLIGESGADTLNGGLGADIFHLNQNGIVTIQDFNRAQGDKIDVTTLSTARAISIGTQGEINIDNFTKATVPNITVDDLILLNPAEESNLFPVLGLANERIKKALPLIEDWVKAFANTKGINFGGKISLEGVRITLDDVILPQAPIAVPSNGIQGVGIWRNSASSLGTHTQSVTIENITQISSSRGITQSTEQQSGGSREISFSKADTTAANWYEENTTGGKFSVGVSAEFPGFGGASASTEISASVTEAQGGSREITTTTSGTNSSYWQNTLSSALDSNIIETFTNNQSITNTITQSVQPQSTFKMVTTTYRGISQEVPITMKYLLSGDIQFVLDNQNYQVPINAILQYYDQQDNGVIDTYTTKQGSRLLGTNFDLNNYSLYYPEFVQFEINGTTKLDTTITSVETSEVLDVVLDPGVINNGIVTNGITKIVDPTTGETTQMKYMANTSSERIWIVKDNFSSIEILPDVITGFSLNNDVIGIVQNTINTFNDLTIEYTKKNSNDIVYDADISFGNIHLAQIQGVEINSLTESHFIFRTTGTSFDPGVDNISNPPPV